MSIISRSPICGGAKGELVRFVWAVIAFIVAAALVGAGIAQRTIFLGPTTQTQQVKLDDTQLYTLLDGTALNALPGAQQVAIAGDADAPVVVAYAPTADVKAWLSDKSYNDVTAKDGIVSSKVVEAVATPVEVTEDTQKQLDAATEAGLTIPNATNPAGSDLWLEQFQSTTSFQKKFELPEDVSILVAADGTLPAPAKISFEWPADNSTPWAFPLMILGGLIFLIGVFLYILGIVHMRRSRGPRRRALPPLEETQPIDVETAKAEARGIISKSTKRKRAGSKKARLAIPTVLVAGLALTGCTVAGPDGAVSQPSPSVTEEVIAPENQMPPAVTEQQATRIIAEVASVVAAADEAKSADIAATRLTGIALDERKTNYALRAKLSDEPAIDAIPSGPYQIILPQQTEAWPRVIMAVWKDEEDDTVAPRIMTLEQVDPWSPYRMSYTGQMEAGAVVPEIAPTQIGALRVVPDSTFLAVKPQDLSAYYADLIDKGADSEYAAFFDLDGDALLPKLAEGRKARLDAFNKTAENETGTLTFASEATTYEPIGLATLQSGAIVSVAVTEVDTVKPANDRAVILLKNNPQVKALTGLDESATGFTATYVDQLFFYVPGQGSSDKVRLIAYSSNMLSAAEIK